MVDYSAAELRDKTDLMKQCIERGYRDGEYAGACFLLAKDNEELCYFDSGYADMEQQKKIRRDSIFRCYSLTKTVTAAAVLGLVEDGWLDLRDPVEKFLPSFAGGRFETPEGPMPVPAPMTIQHLLNMTSGLGYGLPDTQSGREVGFVLQAAQKRLGTAEAMTTQEFADSLGRCTLQFVPGTSWQYGVSADILGAVAEKVTGMSYGDYLRERIFDPLEMKDTGFYVPAQKRERLVQVYARKEQIGKSGTEEKPLTGLSPRVPPEKRRQPARTGKEAIEGVDKARSRKAGPADTLDTGTAINKVNNGLVLYQGNDLCIRNDGGPNPLESGGAGLFSTIDDFFRYTQMLMRGGRGMNGSRVLRLGTVQFMTRHALAPAPQRAFETAMPGLEGFTYANLLRIMQQPALASTISREGEYGWDGALGTYWCNSPTDGITILLMMNQKGYETGHVTHLLRNIVFG